MNNNNLRFKFKFKKSLIIIMFDTCKFRFESLDIFLANLDESSRFQI